MNVAVLPEPNLRRLQQLLFASEHESTYAILDGASVPELPARLLDTKADFTCLYRGELAPDMAEVAPYLVKLRRDSPVTEFVLTEGWGQHWGIFAVTPTGLEDLRRHLRRFLRVRDHNDQILYFRYYDPRVLQVYLPTCKAPEVQFVYGPITRFIAEDEDTGNATIFVRDSTKINRVQEPLT
jgi:hypothetical protein